MKLNEKSNVALSRAELNCILRSDPKDTWPCLRGSFLQSCCHVGIHHHLAAVSRTFEQSNHNMVCTISLATNKASSSHQRLSKCYPEPQKFLVLEEADAGTQTSLRGYDGHAKNKFVFLLPLNLVHWETIPRSSSDIQPQ